MRLERSVSSTASSGATHVAVDSTKYPASWSLLHRLPHDVTAGYRRMSHPWENRRAPKTGIIVNRHASELTSHHPSCSVQQKYIPNSVHTLIKAPPRDWAVSEFVAMDLDRRMLTKSSGETAVWSCNIYIQSCNWPSLHLECTLHLNGSFCATKNFLLKLGRNFFPWLSSAMCRFLSAVRLVVRQLGVVGRFSFLLSWSATNLTSMAEVLMLWVEFRMYFFPIEIIFCKWWSES